MSTPPSPPGSPPPPPPPGAPPPRSPYTPPAASGPGGPPGPAGKRLPWEERDRIGFVEAFVQTVQLVVMDPVEAFSRLRRDGDLVSPILFGVIISWIGMLFAQVWQMIFGSALQGLLEGAQGLDAFFSAPTLMSFIFAMIFFPVAFLIGLFIGAGIIHLSAMLVGAVERSDTGFEGTLKVYAYASVTSLAAIVPLVGSFIQLVWGLVLAIFGLAEVHSTTRGKAALAVLVPLVLCCLCVLVASILFGAMFAAALSGMQGME